jgi:broad specificity phosphatase PhoE
MNRVMRLFLLPLCLFFLAATPKNDTITILIVRHAEKQINAGDDPHLSDAGIARAKALAAVAENAHVGTVYVSQFLRTKETAAPLMAKNPAIPVVTLPVAKAEDYPKLIAKAILAKEKGKVVLVVSHSNIVPGIVEELTKIKVPPIADDEFSRLYIVTLRPGAPPQLIAAQYGCQ